MMGSHDRTRIAHERTVLRPLIRIGMPANTKFLRLERLPTRGSDKGFWCVWVQANPAFTAGTQYRLYDDGSIWHTTITPDGLEENVFAIKPSD